MNKALFSMACIGIALPAAPSLAAPGSLFQRDRNIPVAARQVNDLPALHFASFTVEPLVTAKVDYFDNVYYANEDVVGDLSLTLRPSIDVKSDWGRHEVRATGDLAFENFAQYTSENKLTASLDLSGRYDVATYTNFSGNIGFRRDYEGRFARNTQSLTDQPVQFDASYIEGHFVTELSRVRLLGDITFTKYNYSDTKSKADQTPIDEDFRDYGRTTAAARVEYALLTNTSVFASYRYVNAAYDETAVDHSNDGYDYALGASFDITNLVTGEVSYGYLRRTYENINFKAVSGASYDAKISYFPTQLMTITLASSRSVEESPSINVSGYMNSFNSLSVDHEWSRLLILSAGVQGTSNKYNGIDRKDDIGELYFGARYAATRHISVSARYSYGDLTSKGLDRVPNYKENKVGVSVSYAY